VLFDPARRRPGWDLDEFLATGVAELDAIMATAERLGLPERRMRALDFGCGVGRVTVPLADHFAQVTGVDISASMLELAGELSAGRPNCAFRLVAGDGALAFGDQSFDLVYCSRVLQHLPDRQAILRAITELLRVLGPGGLLVLQVPRGLPLRRRFQPRRRTYGLLRAAGIRPETLLRSRLLTPISMAGLAEREMRALVMAHGGALLRVQTSPPEDGGVEQTTYFIGRATPAVGPAVGTSGVA
jgi:SAM-dependent methyltransferase